MKKTVMPSLALVMVMLTMLVGLGFIGPPALTVAADQNIASISESNVSAAILPTGQQMLQSQKTAANGGCVILERTAIVVTPEARDQTASLTNSVWHATCPRSCVIFELAVLGKEQAELQKLERVRLNC